MRDLYTEFFEGLELKDISPINKLNRVYLLTATLRIPITISSEELFYNQKEEYLKIIEAKLRNALKTFRYNLKETSDEWEKKKESDSKNIEEIMTRYKQTLKE